MRCLLIGICLCVALAAAATDTRALSDGIILVGQADYALALATLQPLDADHPQDTELQYWLGRAYYGEHLYHLAARHLTVAAEGDGTNADFCLWHLRALRKSGALAEALAAGRDYLARFPQNNKLLAEYAVTRAAAGDFPGARESFAQLRDRDPSPDTRASVAAWDTLLDGLAKQASLEPPLERRLDHFTIRYEPSETALDQVTEEVEADRLRMSEAFGVEMNGFRVLLYASATGYARYARILLPENSALHGVAITIPGKLVLWSPGSWPGGWPATRDEFHSTIRHEMVHLAIAIRTRGEGVPLWLNEGLACYYGGFGGVVSGQIPAQPFSLPALDRALLAGTPTDTAVAYAQAHAMATVLVKQLGAAGVVRLLDALAAGTVLPDAYRQISGEPLDTFLNTWTLRYQGK